MNLSGEFKNRAMCGFAMAPSLVATIASIYLVGPSALIPAVITAAIAYPLSKAVANLGHNPDLLTRMNPTQRWKEIANNMGFRKVPPVYRLESDRENAHAGYGDIIIRSELLENRNADEIDNTFAHELAHIKRCDGLVVPTAWYSSMFSGFTAVYHIYDTVFFNGSSSTEAALASGSAFIAFGFAAGLSIPFLLNRRTEEENHKMEFDCDRRAVLATGNVDSGITSLSRYKVHPVLDETDSTSHPAINRRIEALERLKVKMNQPQAF